MSRIHLYIDDSGSRNPDSDPQPRNDGMDCFALGGILIEESHIAELIKAHKDFAAKYSLAYPLHSTKIRGKRDNFTWLGKDTARADEFMADLESMILSLPALGIACVIDRPGYHTRYAEKYREPWMLCKTAYAILVERAAKYADSKGAKLEIYFEQAGGKEDKAIMLYAKSLRVDGMPFEDGGRAAGYANLVPADFGRIILGEPHRVTKKVPMIQFADMLLYPLAKAGYEPDYPPYRKLIDEGKVIDATLNAGDVKSLGVKYSCFDRTALPEADKK